jgi:2-polyprenyl-6-methoxyphenol hydroxylase-like FAD-dependent oxidoreductase
VWLTQLVNGLVTSISHRAVAVMLDVAIVGAGPGGAAAANGIRRAAPQLQVKVFERAPILRRVGFAVALMVSSMMTHSSNANGNFTATVRRATA